jgi:hypothetical protein
MIPTFHEQVRQDWCDQHIDNRRYWHAKRHLFVRALCAAAFIAAVWAVSYYLSATR